MGKSLRSALGPVLLAAFALALVAEPTWAAPDLRVASAGSNEVLHCDGATHGVFGDASATSFGASDAPRSQQIANVLDFIAASVAEGSLAGYGPGNSGGGRLNALINKIESARNLIDGGMIGQACDQLLDALRRTDGQFPPPDFVAGDAAPELALRLETVRNGLACD